MNLEIDKQIYIGDGVYAHFDGYHLVLVVGGRWPEEAPKKIYLDHYCRAALRRILGTEQEDE